MDSGELRGFLYDANAAGYAGGDERSWTKEPDGSTTISFEKGSWRSHDSFFGGEPYAGRTVVFSAGKAVWMMVYYGWVSADADAGEIYQVLRRALMRMPREYPFRGPKTYEEASFVYTNQWDGGLERFSGKERILRDGHLVYEADYIGGEVDQRGGV